MRIVFGLLLFSFGLVFQPSFSYSEDLVLVSDVHRQPRVPYGYSSCTFGSKQIFFADDGLHGNEPWIGDTLMGSSFMLKDINPGLHSSNIQECVEVNGIGYFSAESDLYGQELWRTDGTPSGTFILKDIIPGTEGSNASNLVAVGGQLVFVAKTSAAGRELWISDGTEAGTQLLADIVPGATSSNPYNLRSLGSKVVSSCEGSGVGRELCIVDTANPGASPVIVNINPGAAASSPTGFLQLNSILVFRATTSANGFEYFRTDGTAAGTALVKDIVPGATSGVVGSVEPVVYHDKVYFTGKTAALGEELWVTDGTDAGTALFKDSFPGATGSTPNEIIVLNDKLLFFAKSPTAGREIFVSDGTPAGTDVLLDLNPGAADSFDLYGSGFAKGISNTKAFFNPSFSSEGQELYSTDGTAAGTQRVSNIVPGSARGGAYFLANAGSKILFGAPAVVASLPGTTTFLSNGTESGSAPHPGTMPSFTGSSNPVVLGTLGSKVIFAADDGVSGYELWSTDGTDAGTARIVDSNAGTSWSVLPQYGATNAGAYLVFVGVTAANGAELWRTDGTAAGTSLLKDIELGASSAFSFYVYDNGRVFYSVNQAAGPVAIFAAVTSGQGMELWKSDGTAAGTVLLSDINPGVSSGLSESFYGSLSTAINPTTSFLYFAATDATHGEELWVTDGTSVVPCAEVNPGGGSSSPRSLTAYQYAPGYVLFSAENTTVGREPMVAFGTTVNMLKDVVPGVNSSYPDDFASLTVGGSKKILFDAYTIAEGREPRVFDVSSSTLTLLKDIAPGTQSSYFSEVVTLSDSLAIFRGCSDPGSNEDCELWKTNGTVVGTVRIKDIFPGTGSSYPLNITAFNGNVYFYATDSGSNSHKFYRSDGTESGTYALTSQGQSEYLGSLVSMKFVQALGTLFVPTQSSTYGIELFKLGEDACPSDTGKSIPGLCGCGVPDVDGDGDGIVDCADQCTADPMKNGAGACGCGVPDADRDGDGVADCIDQCALDPKKSAPGVCGCGVSDGDASGNGVIDCLDLAISSVTPPKPKLKLIGKKTKKPKVEATFTAKVGTNIVVYYRSVPLKKKKGQKLPKFKSKLITTSKLKFAPPKSGFRLEVKYRYKNKDATGLESAESAIARFKSAR